MVKIFNKKIFLTFLFILLTSSFAFSQNFGLDLLKNSNFTLNCPFSFTTGSISNYAKANLGAEARIGTNLFKNKNDSFSLGLCTTYNFNAFLFPREEVKTFYSHSILEGIWLRFALPNDFILQTDLDFGMAFTKVMAIDIRGKTIDDVFNSFVIGSTVVVTRRMFNMGQCALFWDAGLECRIYIEKDSCFQTFGIVAGFMIQAR